MSGSDRLTRERCEYEVEIATLQVRLAELTATSDLAADYLRMRDQRDAALERLAAAEARADHVSFENEVDTQQLEAKLAAAEARVKELESRGILNMDEVVNQFYEGE